MHKSYRLSAALLVFVSALFLSIFQATADHHGHDPVRAAVDNPARSDGDRARDALRKPAEVVSFFGIKPGMVVLDMLAGSGYYTEILSAVVGDKGKVIALNNKAYLGYTKDALRQKAAMAGRMENVHIKIAEINDFALQENSLDAIFLIQSYHDFYYVEEKEGWPKVKGKRTLAQFHKALKKGGVLAVIDHAAPAGSPRESGNSLHRIDPAIVEQEITAAGFSLAATSDLLSNPADDGKVIVFDKSIRGKTDRFIMRFVK